MICRYEYWAWKNVCLIGIAGGSVARPMNTQPSLPITDKAVRHKGQLIPLLLNY